MRFPPPEVMATWPTPNYIDPVKRGPALMIVQLTILPIALICLALRLHVRINIVNRAGWDDWLMVASAICGCGVTISVILATQVYGWDIHVWDLTLTEMINGRKISIAGQTIFLFASGLAKISILMSYLRIAIPGTLFRKLTWAGIYLVAALLFIFLVVLWTQCRPASSYWILFATNRDCEAEGPPLMAQTLTTVLTDFIVYALPIPTLYSIKMPRRQRILVMILFGLGGVVVFAGCMRAYWVHYVVNVTYDPTWEGTNLWIWTAVEVNLGVICACAPVLKPLLGRCLGDGSSRDTSGSSSDGRQRLALKTIGGSKLDDGLPTKAIGSIKKTVDVEMDCIPLRAEESKLTLPQCYFPAGLEPEAQSRTPLKDIRKKFCRNGGSAESMV